LSAIFLKALFFHDLQHAVKRVGLMRVVKRQTVPTDVTALLATVDDHITLVFMLLDADRFEQATAVRRPVAGIDIEVYRVEAVWAVIATGALCQRCDKGRTVPTSEGFVDDREFASHVVLIRSFFVPSITDAG
jgi:hypothetical protein